MIRLLPIHYAVRNLDRSHLRLLLSVSASGLVVLLALGAGGFVRGMNASLMQSADEGNVMVLGTGSEESLERSEIPAATAALLSASVGGLRSQQGVAFVSPEVQVQLPIMTDEKSVAERLSLIRGFTPAALLVHSQVQIVEGGLPRPGHDEILVGRLAHGRLGVKADRLRVGNSVQIEGRSWKIVGRMAAPRSLIDAEVWMPLTDLKQLTKRETDSCVIVSLGGGPRAAELADVQSFCQRRLDLEITAMTESAYYSRMSAFFAPIRLVTWITATLIALGGLFGGLNSMYAAFSARVRELGMLQCLGFRRSAIVVSLIQESCLATAAGAVLASFLALAVLDGVAVQFSLGAFGLQIDPPVLFLGLSIGALLGVVGSLPPAIRSLCMPIPESLKSN